MHCILHACCTASYSLSSLGMNAYFFIPFCPPSVRYTRLQQECWSATSTLMWRPLSELIQTTAVGTYSVLIVWLTSKPRISKNLITSCIDILGILDKLDVVKSFLPKLDTTIKMSRSSKPSELCDWNVGDKTAVHEWSFMHVDWRQRIDIHLIQRQILFCITHDSFLLIINFSGRIRTGIDQKS